MSKADLRPLKIAIIGGGPGGMFTAWHLSAKVGLSCEITVYEGSDRVGGQIETAQFSGVGHYEAGAAELYDYSALGPDPLRELIEDELGLQTVHIAGGPCVLDDKILLDTEDLGRHFGTAAREEAEAFRNRCADLLSPESWYFSVPEQDNAHPWAAVRGDDLLEREFTDDAARRYIRAMAQSDVAAAPHQTNGLTFLKNVLMDVPGYMDLYCVIGGNEQIATRLAEELDPHYRPPRPFVRGRQVFGDTHRRRSRAVADIRLNSHVTAVTPRSDGTYKLTIMLNGAEETAAADYVVVAVPVRALSSIHWRSEALTAAIDQHAAHFDHPGNYVRATFLFRRPFWRDKIPANWWMLDAFDGCCVYDESSRYDYGGYGIMAFLIAGNAALELANHSDDVIEQMCLDALPSELADGRELLLDARVRRWVGTVSAIPGGVPVRQRRANHYPDPIHSRGLMVVGDYLFDATLNGALDSAEVAADLILADVVRRRHEKRLEDMQGTGSPAAVNEALACLETMMSLPFVVELLKVTWGLQPGARLLHLGSGSGHMVASLQALGFDATGVECSPGASLATPPELAAHNILCDFALLPYGDGEFDAVIDTGLYRTAPEKAEAVLAELYRVTRNGVLLGSVTIDQPIEILERFNLLCDAESICSRWDWAEKFRAAGFSHALFDPSRLGEAWDRAKALGVGPKGWYDDSESLLYCVYERSARRQNISPPIRERQVKQKDTEVLMSDASGCVEKVKEGD